MSVTSVSDLFRDLLRDVYYAEKQLTKALPKMAKAATDAQLSTAFSAHLEQTKEHVARLERVFEMVGETARGKKCEAMEGLLAEGKEVMDEVEDDHVMDVGLIGAGQAVEHYEMARYGTLIAWAKVLGHKEAAAVLLTTLNEEKAADALLSKLAGRVNAATEAEKDAA